MIFKMERIEFYLIKSLFGFDALHTPNGNPKDGQIIGRFLNLDPLVEYLHLSNNYIPLCMRKDGKIFRVGLGETVHIFNKDRLYFQGDDNKTYPMGIKAGKGPEKYMPTVSPN